MHGTYLKSKRRPTGRLMPKLKTPKNSALQTKSIVMLSGSVGVYTFYHDTARLALQQVHQVRLVFYRFAIQMGDHKALANARFTANPARQYLADAHALADAQRLDFAGVQIIRADAQLRQHRSQLRSRITVQFHADIALAPIAHQRQHHI